MRLSDASITRLQACLLAGGATGCIVYAGILLRRRWHRSGPPPVVQCPFSDNTVALLRDLHDGPFRFGDPTPVAAAARREAMRRIRRQKAHRRRLRRKMRMLFRSQQDHQAAQRQQSLGSALRPAPTATNTVAHTETAKPIAGKTDVAQPLQKGSVGGVDLNVSSRRAVASCADDDRFAEQQCHLQEKTQRQQRSLLRQSVDAVTGSVKRFARRACGVLSLPSNCLVAAARSRTSSLTGSEAWDLRDTERRPLPRSSYSRSSSSLFLSSDLCSSRSLSMSSSFDSYTTTTTSSFSTASSQASARDDAASVTTIGSAATQERLAWSCVDTGGPPYAAVAAPSSFSNLSHPADPVQSPVSHFAASYSHAAPVLTGGCSHPLGSAVGSGTGGGAASASYHANRYSHQHLQHHFDCTATPSYYHFRSASQPGVYPPSGSYPDGAFASVSNAALLSAVGDGAESYCYAASATLYGPPLFATEMDVTDALAELRSTVCYSVDRQGGSCLGNANLNGSGAFNMNSSTASNHCGLSNAGSLGGGGGGGGGGGNASSLGGAHFLGGALTLSAMGQQSSLMGTMPSSSQGLGGSSYPYYSQGHHHHSRGHRSSAQGGAHHHHLSHQRTTSMGPPRSSSTGGGSGPYPHGASRNSQRYSNARSFSNSQLLPVSTISPVTGGYNAVSPLMPSAGNGLASLGPTGAPLSRVSSLMHSSMAAHPHVGMAAGATGSPAHRRPTYRLRRWWRRTRRHMRRLAHDWRIALTERVVDAWSTTRRLCVSGQQACVCSVQRVSQCVSTRGTVLAKGITQQVQRRLRRAPPSSPGHLQDSDGTHEADASVPIPKHGVSDSSPAKAATSGAPPAEGDTKQTEQASLDADSMEEAINMVVEMLAPCPGRVPTVVVIRAPLGYDVLNDAESLWAALHLDSTSFEEGLVDVVMMEELKTEPLPPAPPAPHSSAYDAASRRSSMAREAAGASKNSSEGGESSDERHADGAAETAKGPQSLPHPLSRDSAAGRQPLPTGRPDASRPSSSQPPSTAAAPQRSSLPQATQSRKGDLRITFELYPAHIFYSSIIRAAILQEKDLALRRAAAELYGGSADLEGGNGGAMEPLNAAAGRGGGSAYGSPSSPLPLARVSSFSVLGSGQRSGSSSHCGGTCANNGSSSGALSLVDNCCVTPIASSHFLRAPNSPKLAGMHHAHSTPSPAFSHQNSSPTGAATGGTAGTHSSATHAHSNGLPLLPSPTVPLVPSPAAAAGASGNGARSGAMPSPTSLSPTFKPSIPGSASNVVVRLSASYSFPALPQQMVRSPMQSAQGAVPHSPRGVPLPIGGIGAPTFNAPSSACGCGTSTSPQGGHGTLGRTPNPNRYSAARRFINRSEVLLYIHVLRTVVADAQTTATTLPSCVISDAGQEDGIGGVGGGNNSASDTATSLGSAIQRNLNHAAQGGGGAAADPNAGPCAAKAPFLKRGSHGGGKPSSYDGKADAADENRSVSGSDAMDVDDVVYDDDISIDEREEEARTLLELRQREIEAPVLLRYRLRICRQGKRSLEALRRTEKYAQEHIQGWQEEAKKMLQAMPPTGSAVMVSAVASRQRLSSVSTPSLMATVSPVLHPADAASARLPPTAGGSTINSGGSDGNSAAQRPIQQSNSRFSGLLTLPVRATPLAGNQELDREEERDSGPLQLPAWAMEVLVRRESMRETLICDLKEKAFRICSVPLPDMRVHCILPPVVPRYTVAHARGFPLSRTFAEEVLSQQRTLQYILLQREQENQRVIAAEIRRAMRRQERHAQRRRERRAREEERQHQRAEKKQQSLKARFTNSMNPATIVSCVASMVKMSTGRDLNSLNSMEKGDRDDVTLDPTSVTSQTKLEAHGPPSLSIHDQFKLEAQSEAVQQHRRQGQPAGGDFYGSALPGPQIPPNTLDSRGGYTTSWTMEDDNTLSTATATTESDLNAVDGGVTQNAMPQRRQRPLPYQPPFASLLPSPQQPPPPEVSAQPHRRATEQPSRGFSERNGFFGGEGAHSSVSCEGQQGPASAMAPHVANARVTGPIVGAGGNAEAVSGLVNTPVLCPSSSNASGNRSLRGMRCNTPSTLLSPASAATATSLVMGTNSSRSSPAPPPLSLQTHALQSQPSASSALGGGGGTSPPVALGGIRSSYWTAVHTATNANTSVPLPPPLLSSIGSSAVVQHPTEGGDGPAAQLLYATSSSMDLSAIEEGADPHRPFPIASVDAASKAGAAVNHPPSARPRSADGTAGLRRHRESSPVPPNASGHALLPPPPLLTPQARIPVPSEGYFSCSPAPASGQSTFTTTPITRPADGVNRATGEALGMDPSMSAVVHGGGQALGLPPPVQYFARPQTAAGAMLGAPCAPQDEAPFAPSTRAALLVPTAGYASASGECGADVGRLLSPQNSFARSPLQGEGLPASSIASTPLAVPNNSMYGTFDAYYGHSTATPQAVLLRQQARAAAVAGLTSGGAVPAPSSSPSHLRRPSAASAAVGSHTRSPGASASNGMTSSAVAAVTRSDSTAVDGIEGGWTTAGKLGGGGGGGGRLGQQPTPPKSTSTTRSHRTSPPPSSMAQQLLVPRSAVAAGGNGSSAPRCAGSGLLPYNYSADSVSSMCGIAYYPLYRYPDDTGMSATVGAPSSVGNTGFAFTGLSASHSMVDNVHSDSNLRGLANGACATATYISSSSTPGSAHGGHHHPSGEWGPLGGSPREMDSPIEATAGGGGGGATPPIVMQDTHMNRLKQYNKLLSDLLGVAGGPMRSGISFYYTYGDATALLYNASIQAPSDEDILELLGQQPWVPQSGQEVGDWDGPLETGCVDTPSSGLPLPVSTSGSSSSSNGGQPGVSGSSAAGISRSTRGMTTPNDSGAVSSTQGSGSTFAASSASPSPSAARVPPTLVGIGDSPPVAPPLRVAGDASSANAAVDGDATSAPSSRAKDNALKSGVAGTAHEDEGCSYLNYADMPYPEDLMDALEAEQIDAQRTRNKNFYSIFEHLHRAYHDAVFVPREPADTRRPQSLPHFTSVLGSTAATAVRQSPPPLGGFTATASFTGSPGSPRCGGFAQASRQRGLSIAGRVYAYAYSLVQWVGWKLGLAAAPAGKARNSVSNVADIDEAAMCGVLSDAPTDFPHSFPCPPGSEREQSDAERLAKQFPGERIVTFGREWRVVSHLDMHNGHYGLSPLQVWMATRYSRRFAGEVYLMDVVAAGSDPYYPAVRVLDEVVAHAVLYYHNHSLRDFTKDLASELGLEYVPQTTWGRRALGLPIDEAEVQELDGLLYSATRRRQDRCRRQQELRRRRAQEQRKKQLKPTTGPNANAGAACRQAKEAAIHSNVVQAAKNTDKHIEDVNAASAALNGEALGALEYGNDVGRPAGVCEASRTVGSAHLSHGVDDGHGTGADARASPPDSFLSTRDGGEDTPQQQQQDRTCARPSSKLSPSTGHCSLVHAATCKPTSYPVCLPTYIPVVDKPGVDVPSSDGGGSNRQNQHQDDSCGADLFADVDVNLWIDMQSFDQEEDEEVFYGATAAAVVGIGSGDINMAPHIYDAVMEREVYDERMLLRELDHLKDFLIENRNVLSSAMLTTAGSNALEAVFGVPATVFPFLLCARESVPLISSVFESLSYHYGALTYDNFSKMTYDAFHMDRPDVLRHTPRLFRMVNKSRRGCITYEELCGWLARKLSCGNNIQPNAHLLAAIMSLRLPLALVAESRADWGNHRCALKSLSDAEDEEY
ncbi:hypothetical protein ABL78_5324 [Leptomonas seymouri]|uniref:Uncharacterized protein n=1 Tax=Leptomonas seymouri TaxID=5684 RepID=A0A0N1I4Z4_LEPSE|nr:hypothetical protein ABL78_5324 [Leptomonas seymouri]|eukprot:KPI85614.1 hypothetical protein ABL78_5324 [Leptomonas seymouri]